MQRCRRGSALLPGRGIWGQTTGMTRVFPLAILVSLGGVCFLVNHQDAGIVPLCCMGPHPTCPSWKESRSLTRLEQKIPWQTPKCHFMVTQSSHFLIPHEEELSLDTSSGLGLVTVSGDPKIPWFVPLPPFPGSAQGPQRPYSSCAGKSKGWILHDPPPHLPHCLEHPHLG